MCLIADDSECGAHFPSREGLERAVRLYLAIEGGRVERNSQQMAQLLFPNMTFTCNGTVSSLIIGAEVSTGGLTAVPDIQVWRLNEGTSDTYSQVDSVSLFGDLIQEISDKLAVYKLDVSLSFSTGDILGIFYPGQSNLQLVSLADHGSVVLSRELGTLEPPPHSVQPDNNTQSTSRQWPLVAFSEGNTLKLVSK